MIFFIVYLVIAVIVFYFVINIATATKAKLELLKNIEKRNSNTEILLRQLVSVKAPVQELVITDLEIQNDSLAVAKKIIDELSLKLILNNENEFNHKDKAITLGRARTFYVEQCKNNGVNEDQAIKVYEDIMRKYMNMLSPKIEKQFIEQYIIGIRSVGQSAKK